MSAALNDADPAWPEFGQYLIRELALPLLAEGYAHMVERLRQNTPLENAAKARGIAAALAEDNAELGYLRKQNRELVTQAEKEAERRMSEAVLAHYPHHAIVGEEHGYRPGSQIRWVFDPIDGTSAMIRTAMAQAYGIPMSEPHPAFGITVAVVSGQEAVLGIVSELRPAPALNETLIAVQSWLGVQGQPTSVNGKPLALPPAPALLAEAGLASTAPEVMFHTAERWSGYQALADAAALRVHDQNCIGFMGLLHKPSSIDIAYEADLAYHDAAALLPILQGAGIKVSDDKGQAVQFPESAIASEFRLLAAQPALHALALQKIRAGVPQAKNRFAQGMSLPKVYTQKFPAEDII